MKTRLEIRNLPLNITNKDVKDLVSNFGKIKSVYVAADPRQPNLAFAEVVMAEESEAEKAARAIFDKQCGDKFLATKLAEEDWE